MKDLLKIKCNVVVGSNPHPNTFIRTKQENGKINDFIAVQHQTPIEKLVDVIQSSCEEEAK